MEFAHGSSKDIKEEKLKVYDYIIGHNNEIDNENIDNGNDGEGIGIYAFKGNSEKSISSAAHYTSEESGFVYLLNVDIEEEDLMSNREADEISPEELGVAIQYFIDDIREQKHCELHKFNNVIDYLINDFDNLDLSFLNQELKNQGVDIELDSYADPKEFSDACDWNDEVLNQYQMQEPCSAIIEEGSPEMIAEYCINKSNNLWETIKNIGHIIAVQHTQKGTERYNETFRKAITENLKDYNLVAASVNNDKFLVIFDTDEINITKKIDINAKIKEDLEQEKPKKRNRNRFGK